MLEASFQHLDLFSESNHFSGVGFLGLTDSANSSAQYYPKGGGIKVGDISKKGVQRIVGDRD